MDHLNITTEIIDLAEARRRLPRVAPHVEVIMQTSKELRRLHEKLGSGESLPDEDERKARKRFAALEKKFKDALKAMNDLGAYLKDPESGLIDFYTWIDGEMAFLCWRHGEDTINWWHGLSEGFSGRKPLP